MNEQYHSVSIITINFNGKPHLEELLKSIESLDYPKDKFEVIVVDNNSKDGSVDYLTGSHPEVRIIRNEKNMGFAYPCNQGARIAGGKFLAFLNNDMRLDASWLKEMTSNINYSDNTICVASKILNYDGTRIDFIGGGTNYAGFGFQHHFGKNVDEYDVRDNREILFACGGAMLIDKKVFLEVGGFDEDYFAFFEDVDLGWRLWVLGYKVLLAPKAVAYHKHHQTASRLPVHKLNMLYERNSLYTIYKNYGDETIKRAFPAALIMSSVRMLRASGVDISEYLIEKEARHDTSRIVPKKNPIKMTYRKVAGEIIDTISSIVLDFRLKSRTCVRKQRTTNYPFTPVVAIAHFCLTLDKMKGKRIYIQNNRKKTDKEITELFDGSFGTKSGLPVSDDMLDVLKNLW